MLKNFMMYGNKRQHLIYKPKIELYLSIFREIRKLVKEDFDKRYAGTMSYSLIDMFGYIGFTKNSNLFHENGTHGIKYDHFSLHIYNYLCYFDKMIVDCCRKTAGYNVKYFLAPGSHLK